LETNQLFLAFRNQDTVSQFQHLAPRAPAGFSPLTVRGCDVSTNTDIANMAKQRFDAILTIKAPVFNGCKWREDCTRADLMGDDMFEKAREAFFGTVRKSAEPSAAPTEAPKPQDETPTEEDGGPPSDKS